MRTKFDDQLYSSGDYHKVDVADLLPPPFVNIILQLVDNEHLKAYNKGSRSDIIPFEGLSSGERQIAYTISNIIYHIKNIQSGKHDINSDPNHMSTIKYDYINILLDEVELYFHPDLQRRFINLLLNAISGLNLNQSSGINITLVTHSPFVLSDIPESNVLYLERNGSTEGCGQTFAANIHDLFNNTFILPYTIGEYAQTKISEIVDVYNVISADRLKIMNRWQHDISYEYIETKLSGFKYIANQIGDRYLHVELTDMVSEIESWVIERRQNNKQK
jgi:predicted ATP-binding protein involved in virulence